VFTTAYEALWYWFKTLPKKLAPKRNHGLVGHFHILGTMQLGCLTNIMVLIILPFIVGLTLCKIMCLTNNIVFHTIHYGINNDNTKIYHMNTPKKPPSCGRLAEAAASAGVPTERAGR